ncbi:MAG: protoporphyrinogen oxidase [Rubripirellula sp.]
MSRNPPVRVAVVGGGLSGLATAAKLHLLDPSVEVSLFERLDRVGGVIHTERVGPFLVDHGADMFSTKPAAALEFCQEIGLENRLIEPNVRGRGARIVREGKLLPIPNGFVVMRATQRLPMLTTPLLSWKSKLRFLMERWVRPAADKRDESVADFVRRRMGSEVLDRIVAPLSAGIYTADVTKLSMQATMRSIANMEQTFGSLAKATAVRRRTGEDSVERNSTGARYGQFRAMQGGMVELIQGIANCLPDESIHNDATVTSLQRSGDQWELVVNETAETFDHVVIALPPSPAAKLLEPLANDVAEELRRIQSASTAIVVLGVRRVDIQRPVDTFGFVVPLSENRRILAGSFASQKFSGRAPDDHVLIRVFIGGAMQPELLKKSDVELTSIAMDELSDLIGLTGDPVMSKVVRWNQAMPQYHVGHTERVKRIDDQMAKLEGLSLVSNALHGVGIAPVIQLADKTARNVLEQVSASSDATHR